MKGKSFFTKTMGFLNENNDVVVAGDHDNDVDNVDIESLSNSSERQSHSTSDFCHKSTSGNSKEALIEIARREQRHVRIIRIVTFAAVIVCAVSVSTLVYYFTTGSDTLSFELEVRANVYTKQRVNKAVLMSVLVNICLSLLLQYNLLVHDIQTLVVWEVQYNFALVKQLCGTITSEAIMSNQVFPNVTLPHFEVTGGFVDGMGGIMMALFAPLIPASQKEQWEEYSVQHQDWLNSSALLKVVSPSHRDPLHGTIQDHEHDRFLEIVSAYDDEVIDIEIPGAIPPEIWKWDGDEKVAVDSVSAHDAYAPIWQSSPHHADTVNVDLFSDPRISALYSAMLRNNETVLSPGFEIGNLFDWMFDPIEKPQKVQPHGFIMEKVQVDFGKGKEVAGFVLGLTSFRNLFTRLVPEGTQGIYAVVRGTPACGRNMTFLLTRRSC
jgi:hypothetical protein